MNSRLLAIKITARAATVAIYFGRELHYTEVRQLASDRVQATDSLVGFLSSLVEHFRIDSAVSQQSAGDTRAMAQTATILALLHERAIPHWAIEWATLLEAYGEVPLKRGHELRKVVSHDWPHIVDERHDGTCLDAAALGLYLQTERMLSENYLHSL